MKKVKKDLKSILSDAGLIKIQFDIVKKFEIVIVTVT